MHCADIWIMKSRRSSDCCWPGLSRLRSPKRSPSPKLDWRRTCGRCLTDSRQLPPNRVARLAGCGSTRRALPATGSQIDCDERRPHLVRVKPASTHRDPRVVMTARASSGTAVEARSRRPSPGNALRKPVRLGRFALISYATSFGMRRRDASGHAAGERGFPRTANRLGS
jgi:hypothetical protein